MPLATSGERLALAVDLARACTEVDGMARTQIAATDRQIGELEDLGGSFGGWSRGVAMTPLPMAA